MWKKTVGFMCLAMLSWMVCAQDKVEPRFGYLNYTQVLKEMPQYLEAEQNLNILQGKYDAEIERAEEEFSRKYAEFLQDQHEFPQNIMVKRHKELQELMERSIAFKEEIRQTLRNARDEMLEPLVKELDEAIAKVAERYKFDCVFNTENKSYLYMNPQAGKDITDEVSLQVGIRPKPKQEIQELLPDSIQ